MITYGIRYISVYSKRITSCWLCAYYYYRKGR